MMKHKYLSFLLCMFSFMFQSCGIYSFTGTNLSKDIKTFSVRNFGMNTAGAPQDMSLKFSEKLKEYYQRNTSLKQNPNNGDMILEGSFIAYELSPVSQTTGDKAAQTRLTVTVEVHFTNKLNELENFEKEFSFYQDFGQDQSLSQVEASLVPKILDQLVLNIFNDTAATW